VVRVINVTAIEQALAISVAAVYDRRFYCSGFEPCVNKPGGHRPPLQVWTRMTMKEQTRRMGTIIAVLHRSKPSSKSTSARLYFRCMHESMLATLGFGLVLGLKHATEADHLAAVSTIVSEKRSFWQSAAVGALWGLGHTASLLVAGLFVLGFGLLIPERVANFLELAVAVMIIVLGMRVLRMHIHAHTHGGRWHIHFHFRDEKHAGGRHSGLPGWRPLIVGVVHGLAGSAALTLLVLSQVVRNGGMVLGFVYLMIFGIGSIAGMLLMSSIIGLPFWFGARLFQRVLLPLRVFTAIFTTGFGVFYAWRMLEKLSML
jgi:sulfite exporter TauE/SafE